MYKLISYMGETPATVRKYTSSDKTQWIDIPMRDGNLDYAEYQAWVAAGNTPEPA